MCGVTGKDKEKVYIKKILLKIQKKKGKNSENIAKIALNALYTLRITFSVHILNLLLIN